MSSSDDASDISESEIFSYSEKPYEKLKNGELKVQVRGVLRCPFCCGKKKLAYKYKELYQHASGVAKGSANRTAKFKANHAALARYLTTDLADKAEPSQPVVTPKVVAPLSKEKDLIVYPWMGIAARKVRHPKEKDMVMDSRYWLKKFDVYQPSEVCTFWNTDDQSVQVVLSFNPDWKGFAQVMEFDKSFESERRGRENWGSQRAKPVAVTYGWWAKANDYDSEGPIGEYLRKRGKLTTTTEVKKEEAESTAAKVTGLAYKIDERNNDLKKWEEDYVKQTLFLARMLEENDKLQLAFLEETTKMQQLARDNVCRILQEQENLKSELEAKKSKIHEWNKELNQREALTEHEQRMLEEGKIKVKVGLSIFSYSNSLHLASVEQKKADEDLFRLIELQKREKEEAMSKILELEKQLDAKQKLDMEIEDLKGKIKVKEHYVGKDDSVKAELEKLNAELKDKTEDLDDLESLVTVLTTKERESNDELQEARKVWLKGFGPHDPRMKIGVKGMGEISPKPFVAACKKKFPPNEVEMEAITLCSLWQDKVKDPAWHPFKVITSGDTITEVVEDDETLTSLKAEWGDEVYNAVVTSLQELNEYNPSGRYVLPELWQFKQGRRATLKEVVAYVFETIKKGKKKA
uniref:Factor of DNA methylation 1-like A n=1 Tax=Hypericum perforatum TaxID=65561 RepID=A0A4Y5U2V1_HYPPE|nr:factor of DNA methylation 1-like A [Hypericum perforatum]